jgi:hypothetical protein
MKPRPSMQRCASGWESREAGGGLCRFPKRVAKLLRRLGEVISLDEAGAGSASFLLWGEPGRRYAGSGAA